MSADGEIIGYKTLQFANGGAFDAEPTDANIHLVRATRHGTPGPTLCGIDRFAKDSPGWSVGGGVSGPMYHFQPCTDCLAAMAPLPVSGSLFADLFAARLDRDALAAEVQHTTEATT